MVVENDHVSFTLDGNFDYEFPDANQEQTVLVFPFGGQKRAVVRDKDYPHSFLISICCPCPTDASDLLGDTTKKKINVSDVTMAESEGFLPIISRSDNDGGH